MYSDERDGQTNATCLIQHLDSRVLDHNLPNLPGVTVSLTPLSFLFLFEEKSLVFKLSSMRDSKTLFVRHTGA